MDPLEISSDKIFIPESIIDKTKSFKYVKYLNYTLTINDIKNNMSIWINKKNGFRKEETILFEIYTF